MTRRAFIVAFVVVCASVTFPRASQQLGASRTALATVVDARGRSIVDIEPDDFVVRESGRTRDVLSVRVADYPIAVVLDNGLGAGRDVEAIRAAIPGPRNKGRPVNEPPFPGTRNAAI
jgi:hypothetical protein